MLAGNQSCFWTWPSWSEWPLCQENPSKDFRGQTQTVSKRDRNRLWNSSRN